MIDVSNLTSMAGSDPARVVDTRARPRADRGTGELARAYRAGRLVCACVHVTVRLDDRLDLASHERRVLRVSFQEPLDDGLRVELAQLVRRRGAAACRVAERIDPIEFVVDDRNGSQVRVVGRLEPPHAHHGSLRDIKFELRRVP
jgi:hypothetical protein